MAKKIWELMQEDIERNKQASENLQREANEKFNNLVSKKGEYDTSKHTSNVKNITNAYKQTSKTSANNFKRANRLTLWDTIKQTANDTGKIAQNTWLGLENGVKSFKQTLGRAITNTQADRMDFWNKQNEEMLKTRVQKKTEEAKEINKVIDNPLFSGDKIREESDKVTQKIKEEKDKNTEKIQENANSINNPVGKYLAGDIMPAIGQMAPGLIGGATYFVGSATGNYYDDAKQRGMNEKEATIYSGTMGIIEGSLESLGAKLTTNVGKNLLKKNIKGALVNYGLDIGENFLEEAIVEPVSELVAQTTAGKDKANWGNIGQRFLQSGIDGAVVSMITGGLSGIAGGVASNFQNNKYTDINTGEKLNKDSQNWLKEAENIINSNNTPNLQQQSTQTQQILPTQQITQKENKVAQNGNIEQRNMLPIQNYIYEKSDNLKIDNLRQDVSKYWDNSEKTKNYVNMLEKIIQDKDIDIRLDANLTDSKGNIANGSYSNGVITINPNSTRAGEFIAVHELTHAIGTDQMRNIVQKYRESNAEFDRTVKSLLQNYNATELTEEAMSDVAGQLFGNQEFINNLAQTEPSLFKKIYNEIKYLWHQFTGYKNQDQFINDLQYKWEQAYRNNAKLNETTNYSIAGRKSLENIRDNKMLYNSGISSYNQAQQMANKNISNEQIRKQTGWFQDKNGDWKYEISDKNLNIRNNITLKKNGEYSLNQIIEHDTLFKLYPELENIDIKFKDTKDIGGNYKNKSIILSNDLLGNNKKIEKTLVHEIQHAIQEIEGFETGITSKLSKKVYYENLGEIEADNVSKRFIDEKYNYIDISNIAPESSKSNPKHRNYDKYMKNRNTIDKIKDGVFKYAIKGGNSNDINQEYVEQTNGENIQDSNKEIWNRLENSKESSFSMQDNKGRTLTKQQQEFFKDSKARDENGNLLEVYHGTNEDFTEFDISYLGSASGDVGFLGDGFYLATHKGEAKYYGSKIMNGYVNIKNPYNIKDLSKYNGKTFDGEDSSSGLHIKNLVELNPQWRDIEINNTTYGEIADEVANYLENVKIKKLGIVEDSYGNDSGIMWEIAFNGKKTQDESILNYTEEEMIANGLNKHIRNKFGYINSNEIIQYITEENRFNKNVKTLREVLQEKGYDSIVQGTPQDTDEIVIFNSNQFKNIDNTKPTDNQDIRYSLPTKEWQQHLEENYKSTGTRTNLKDIKLPTQETSKEASINLPTEAEKIDWNDIERPEGKIRKHYRSVIESSNTTKEAKAIAKEMMGTDTYVPDSNNKQLERANERIESSTPDSELNSLMSRAKTGGKIDATDIAVGERLIQYYSLVGDKVKLQDAIQATAMAGTTAGQTVQAMSLLNHQTPEGQAIWLQRSVEKMNNDLKKNRGEKAQQFDLKPEMVDKIVKSKNNEELNNNLNEVYQELGQQVSKTTLQKVDSWRYFSMLANPRTHIRNIIGNTAMGKTQGIKNKIAGSIEGVISKINPDMERTHTIVPSSKKVKEFAKNDIKNVADRLGLNENKYNPKTRLESSMRTFKSDVMENTIGKLFDANSKLLEAEDAFGLKSAYKKALSEYMTANKLTPDNITDKQLAKARNYAVEQAQEATFHQASSLATLINQLGNKNKFAKYALDATLPFKKTPINVAKSGIEYSPVGLAKSIIYDSVQLRKGNITVNKYIDNISKGLTGTGIALVGYALAKAGILKASGSDDKEGEKFDEEIGNQTYSIKIGENTYSLDWLAPTGIPLFIGAETFEIMQTENEEKESSSDEDSKYNQAIRTATNLLDASANAMNPMTEMSMLSGLTSALKSYEQGSSQMLASLLTNSAKSYVNQFVPTALGQVAKTADEYERSTTSTKSGILPRAIDTTKNQIMNKVPGLRQMLPTKTDIWGNNIKQSDNIAQRAFENAIAPYTRKEISSDKVNKELSTLYKNTGESSILPDSIDKTFTINSEKYRMTNEEYSKYKENYGKTSYKLLNELINSRDYKNMTNAQKQKAIESVYSYAKESNKIDYAKNNNLEVENSTVYTTMQDLNKNGGNQSEYLNYIGKTLDIEKDREKNQILANSDYTNKTKTIIYANTTGKDDNLYNITLKNSNIDIDEYLEYKVKDSKEEFSADKDSDGNSISGTSKKKYYSYINSNITDTGSRLIILGSKYKLSNSERHQLSNYINKISSNNEEAIQTFEYLSKNYVVKGGKVYYK